MIDFDAWEYAQETSRKKRRKEAQEFLDKVGYDFDKDNLSIADDFRYMFVKPEVDELVQEHNNAMSGLRELRNLYLDTRDLNGSYHVAENGIAVTQSDEIQRARELGKLSAKMESNKNKDIFGYDRGGGWSYGKYQIETNYGTMKDFLLYANKNPKYKPLAQKLEDAGGYASAKAGTEDFKNMWGKLTFDKTTAQIFEECQDTFILKKKVGVALRNVRDIKGLNFENRPLALQQYMHSIINHLGEGRSAEFFHNALGYNVEGVDDITLLNMLYRERMQPEKYFKRKLKNKTDNMKKNRFSQEYQATLKKLMK